MTDRYEPASDFLKAILADMIPLSGNPWADHNLCALIELTTDADTANRDWATFLLAQANVDTPIVRTALLHATADDNEHVRAGALLGLAERDPSLALPLVQSALAADRVCIPILEAAALCAHPSLIDDLRVWAAPSDDEYIDGFAIKALAACENADELGQYLYED